MAINYLYFTLRNFQERKLRSFLTILGIFIGITAVVALISIGQGLQETIEEQFELLGTDKIIITPSGGYYGVGAEGTELTKADLDIIKKINGVDKVMEMITKVARVEYGDELKYTWVTGVATDSDSLKLLESFMGLDIKEGRSLKEGDLHKAVITIYLLEGKFFDKEVKIRDTIAIEGEDFKVVGCLEQIGNPQDDSQLLIPLDSAREIFNEPEDIDFIFLQVKTGFDVKKVANDIKEELRDSRGVEEGDEDFVVQTSDEMLESFSSIFSIVQIVVIGLAAISLLVGGVGIANTMYTGVLERTRQIGIMKAVGARNSDIMLIFLFESGLLGLVGGALGVLFGLGISKLAEAIAISLGVAMVKASLNPFLIIGALLFSFVVGSVSGLMPARQAAKLKPVDALRYE